MPSLPASPIWVMEDREATRDAPREAPVTGARRFLPGSGWPNPAPLFLRAATPAVSIAGRLGLPFRRIGEDGPDGRVAPGSLPALILCCGRRSAARALLHKARHGGLVVHCLRWSSMVPHRWLALPFDLLVAPQRGSLPPTGHDPGNLVSSIGAAQPVSPALLARARVLWQDRLAYLPWPRLSLVVGRGAPDPGAVASLARQLTAMMRVRGGCILATTLAECPPEAAQALASGLAGGPHLLHRAGEPGADPQLGFLGGADAILVAWTGPAALSEACAADGPVFLMPGGPARTRDLAEQLLARDQVRVWPGSDGQGGSKGGGQGSGQGGGGRVADPFLPWPRAPLDEAGRIAGMILGRHARLRNTSLEPDVPEQA